MRRLVVSLLFIIAGLLATASSVAAEQTRGIDPTTGLVVTAGWELASAHCGACHSHRLVTAQRGDAEFWLRTIRWMQKTQNLWQIPDDQEQVLISYLAENYNETDWGRRPALPASLRP
jgi:hypothetical protein